MPLPGAPALPEPIQNLIEAFAALPGIGPKSASRLTFYLLKAPEGLAQNLAEALVGLKEKTSTCPVCFNIMTAGRERCEVCGDPARQQDCICVVEEPLDVLALERTGGYRGAYHVLHGALSPMQGIQPEDLRIKELLGRITAGGVREVILATNPSMEGDATAIYLKGVLANKVQRVTRLARGLPTGGDLEYTDQSTLLRALAGRQEMD